jgi:hypothetical protein
MAIIKLNAKKPTINITKTKYTQTKGFNEYNSVYIRSVQLSIVIILTIETKEC